MGEFGGIQMVEKCVLEDRRPTLEASGIYLVVTMLLMFIGRLNISLKPHSGFFRSNFLMCEKKKSCCGSK